MQAAGIHHTELIILILLIFVVALAALAKRLQVPYPIVLVIGGLILSFFPRIPKIEMNPDMVFLLILPPLLFSSAYVTSWRDFRFNLVSIGMLAFGLVGFTVFGAAVAAQWFLPGFDWRMGLVVGAVLSTTDAIAATSIAHRVGLPKAITDILEAESLINDATGLIALEFATALLVSGHTPTLADGTWRLLYIVFASIVIGLVIAKLGHMFQSKIDDSVIEITISLIAPYFAYLAGESAHASGVLTTVVAGLYLGHKSSLYLSTGARLTSHAVWETLTFILNGFVFILIGLQLPYVLPGVRALGFGRMLLYGLLLSAVLIVIRLVWMFPGAFVANVIRTRLLLQEVRRPPAREIFIVGWTGMRGVITLAAAISLPEILKDGSPFPQRDVMIFLTFCVIFVTLVFQGLTLPPLIRLLGLSGIASVNLEEQDARRAMIEAALAYLEHTREEDPDEFAPVYDELIRVQRRSLNTLDSNSTAEFGYRPEDYQRWRDLSRQVAAVQRATILHLRNENKINDEVMRKLERELDLFDATYAVSEHA